MKIKDGIKEKDNPSPYVKANFLSKLVFWWLNPLFRLGNKRSLESSDLYDANPEDRSEQLADELHSLMNEPKYMRGRQSKLSFLGVLMGMFAREYAFTGVACFVMEVIRVSLPLFLGYLMDFFDPEDDSVSSTTAYIYGATLAVLSFIQSFPPVLFMHNNQLIAMRMRAAVSSIIYRKSLRLSPNALSVISSGKIVNLMSSDVEKFKNGILFFHYFWICPIELPVLTWLLYEEVGVACFAGLLFVLMLAPLNVVTSKAFGNLRLKIAHWTDQRIRVMNELISGMRVIKMYCWEKPFGKIVHNLRRNEIKYVMRALEIKGQNESLVFVTGKLMTFAIMITYYLLGNDIEPATAIKVLSWSEQLRLMATWMSYSAQYGTEMVVSLGRVQEFLNAEELQEADKSKSVPQKSEVQIELTNVVATWNESPAIKTDPAVVINDKMPRTQNAISAESVDEFCLDSITMHIRSGELVAVVGPVGAGKSSLLMTMLGEMSLMSGCVDMNGKVAYVPQEAWIFSGSIQDNIMFGQSYVKDRYERAIISSALHKDLESFEYGDQTLVGEKGYSLSGGQKARINLARAIYREADIYLLDDPLSAVDAHVGKHIFQKCIRETLKGKTRVLVTHQIQFLKDVDCIYIINEGRVITWGTYEKVSRSLDMGQLLSKDEGTVKSGKLVQRSISIKSKSESILENDLALEEDIVTADEAARPVNEEEKSAGSVGLGVFMQYFSAGYGAILFPLFILLAIANQGAYNASDWVLTDWHKNTADDNYIYLYVGLIAGLVVSGAIRSAFFFLMTSLSSKNLHHTMFSFVLRAPIKFFDSNPVGRILNRFSRDTGFMDDILPQILHQVLLYFMKFAGVLVFVSISNPWTLVITVPVLGVILFLRYYSIKTIMEVKRLEAACRSPTYSHLSATLQGLPVIRAFQMEQSLIQVFDGHQDKQTSAWNLYLSAFRWFGMKVDWCVSVYFTGCIVAAFLSSNSGGDEATLGLSLSYIITLLSAFQFIMRQTAEVESYMTSVERILQYTRLEQEAAEHTSVQPGPHWPAKGTVTFDRLHISYTPGQYVLNDINIAFNSEEKIGVVGRTGAGKTSLLSCLFRLSEPSIGTLWIDDIDIGTLGLTDLRRKISIIPQDPVLFQGTLRYNLDPFSEYNDESIWKALHEVHLSSMVKSMPDRLDAEISEAGSNFSVGQRQLVCLARAILRNNKILVIDEATANVDLNTDQLIQKTLREKFKHCTVLCIAHRLNTIIDSDRILVLEKGEVAQFDTPHALLQDEEGIFYQMVQQTGKGAAQNLHNIARNSYQGMHRLTITDSDYPYNTQTHVDPQTINVAVTTHTGFTNLAFTNDEEMNTYL